MHVCTTYQPEGALLKTTVKFQNSDINIVNNLKKLQQFNEQATNLSSSKFN